MRASIIAAVILAASAAAAWPPPHDPGIRNDGWRRGAAREPAAPAQTIVSLRTNYLRGS
jgi:hypothetical protein